MLVDRIRAAADAQIADKTASLAPETYIQIEKSILLQSLDHHWKEHLAMLDALRQVIHLRAYAQKKPIDEYKHEAFQQFERMLGAIREDVTRTRSEEHTSELQSLMRISSAVFCLTKKHT